MIVISTLFLLKTENQHQYNLYVLSGYFNPQLIIIYTIKSVLMEFPVGYLKYQKINV